MDNLNKIMLFSIISALLLIVLLFIKNKINNEVAEKTYYLRGFAVTSLCFIILLNIYEMINIGKMSSQEILTGHPEF